MNRFFPIIAASLLVLLLCEPTRAVAKQEPLVLPSDALAVLHDLIDRVESDAGDALDVQRIAPFLHFLQSPKSSGVLYHAGDSFGAPSAFHQFGVDVPLTRIIDYTLDENIPSIFFWPSSLRTASWTRVEGGETQFHQLHDAAERMDRPFVLKGEEHLSITPDQHTGAYYSYDVDKLVMVAPYGEGRLMISVYRQQRPSMVGRKGWVLGEDDDWSYLYTQDRGLNIKGLSWAKTYMYDSFGITVYWQQDRQVPVVTCGVISWVKAGWAGINMVQPRHIHRGLTRVAHAFGTVLENPRLPDPASLSATFARSRNLPTPTLREYARNYFRALEQRIAASGQLPKQLAQALDTATLINQMSREELFSTLALDYFKKLLGRDPVMKAHPF